ncbi:hypothetical protein D3C72_1962820 [compost metagenome]
MEVPNENSRPFQKNSDARRAQWYWRVLYLKVWMLATFLIIALFSLGVMALTAAFEMGLEWHQRLVAFGLGAVITAGGLAILKAILPENSFVRLFKRRG